MHKPRNKDRGDVSLSEGSVFCSQDLWSARSTSVRLLLFGAGCRRVYHWYFQPAARDVDSTSMNTSKVKSALAPGAPCDSFTPLHHHTPRYPWKHSKLAMGLSMTYIDSECVYPESDGLGRPILEQHVPELCWFRERLGCFCVQNV